MFTRVILAAFLASSLSTPLLRGEDRPAPLERSDLDRRAALAAYESMTLGSQIYNKGNHEGCYRLYQGTLLALQPLLDHRPKLAERVKESLERAKGMRTPIQASFALREALDAVQTELTGGKLLPKAAEKPMVPKEPLWVRLGGEKAVRAIVHDFLLAAIQDPKVNFTRGGKYPLDARGMDRLEQRFVEFVSAATGGPLKFTGKDMSDAHKGMAITDAEFAALAVDLAASLKKFEVAQTEIDEVLALVASTKKEIVQGR